MSESSLPADRLRWTVCLSVATLVPPLLLGGLLAATTSNPLRGGAPSLLVLLLVGLVAVWQCPIPLWGKIIACIVYTPAMGFLLFAIGAQYVCGAYHDCF